MNPKWLIASMVLAIAAIGGLAWWDEEREAEDGLDEFGHEQARLAGSVATNLDDRLERILQDGRVIADDAANGGRTSSLIHEKFVSVSVRAKDDPKPPGQSDGKRFYLTVPAPDGRLVDLTVSSDSLLAGLSRTERAGSLLVLVQPPDCQCVVTLDGRALAPEEILGALGRNTTTERLPKPAAAALGLPARTAMVGLAHLNAGELGRWGVAVVATAERMRDRDRRGRLRLALALLVASGLVFGFGGLALKNLRAEMLLARELAVAEIARERDARLARLSTAAMMVTLASGVAHELSTPLGVIVGKAEQLLARANGDERNARNAQGVLDQADRIARVVRGFLDLARGTPPTMQTVQPGSVVQGALALVEHRFAKASVHLLNSVEAGLPAIRCEPRLLEHALVNLLINACDACALNGTVVVEARAQADDVAFIVTDDGAGITSMNAARATEPFFTTKPADKGTGLGLAIANEIVKTHRGQLSIAPHLPRGTQACIVIPTEGTAHAEA